MALFIALMLLLVPPALVPGTEAAAGANPFGTVHGHAEDSADSGKDSHAWSAHGPDGHSFDSLGTFMSHGTVPRAMRGMHMPEVSDRGAYYNSQHESTSGDSRDGSSSGGDPGSSHERGRRHSFKGHFMDEDTGAWMHINYDLEMVS